MKMKKVSIIIAMIMMGMYCGKRGEGSSAESGRAIYEANCSSCHGMKGEGDGPAGAALNPKPRNYAKDGFKYGSSIEEVKMTIINGIDGTAMAPFRDSLSEEQIVQVSEYVKSLASQSVQQ